MGDSTVLAYDIDLSTPGSKVGFNLMDYDEFIITNIIDTIANYPPGHQILTQAKKIVCIIAINGDKTVITKGLIDEIQRYHTQHSNKKLNIRLCSRNSYQCTDIEELWSIFDQIRPVVSHLEVNLPEKPKVHNKIGETIKVSQSKLWKETLFVQYNKNKGFQTSLSSQNHQILN